MSLIDKKRLPFLATYIFVVVCLQYCAKKVPNHINVLIPLDFGMLIKGVEGKIGIFQELLLESPNCIKDTEASIMLSNLPL